MWRRKFAVKIKKSNPKIPLRIGILGVGNGIGLTHSCLLLASYLSGCLKQKTALLERNGNKDYEKISEFYGLSRSKFTIWKTDIYSDIAPDAYADIQTIGYDYIISDLGGEVASAKEEFMRNDVCILIIALSSWKVKDFLRILDTEDLEILKSWKILCVFGEEKLRKKLEKVYKVPIFRIPFSPDPFCINAKLYEFFRDLKLKQ